MSSGIGVATPDDPGRDDAGRTDDSPGFELQARIFAILGGNILLGSLVYGLLSKEYAGTTMLALAGLMALTIAAYVGWKKPPRHVSVDEADTGSDDPWFPAASGWPFALGIGLVLVANGVLLGLWLLLPAGAFLLFALGGFLAQSRSRG